jgi:5'-nucleotidase / UDP-sugar diphosphatase
VVRADSVRTSFLAPVLLAALVLVPKALADTQVITVLVTSDENGALLPTPDGDAQKGGAAQMLGKWVAEDKHCPGQAKQDGASPCPGDLTLALSTGDHFNGNSMSTFFQGEPVAQAMARMGYAASGFGNHELDYGKDQFLALRDTGGFPYLAANLKVTKAPMKQLELPPWRIFTRGGARVGVVALSYAQAVATAMADRFFGLEITPYETALGTAVKDLRKAGVDAVVVLADDCPSALEPAVKKHPEWSLSVVVGGHCQKPLESSVGTTPLLNPGRRFEGYARVKLSFDSAKPTGERLTNVDAKVVQVVSGPSAPKPDAALLEMLKPWMAKHDAAFGERIGFTRSGLDAGSDALHLWVTRAIRDILKTDVALVNKGGFRAGLAAGPITRGSVYTVLPFDNSLMTFKLKGDALLRALNNSKAVVAGVTKGPKGYKDSEGRDIVPTGIYSVASVEYLYFGGDGFDFEKQDPLPGESGMMWQTAVVDWTKLLNTNQSRPLENYLKPVGK